jgi:pimeloyl-ACP methyl ester carboxylesterase
VVLDGGTLLDVPIFELMADRSQRALDAVLARCGDDAECAAAFPDLERDLLRTMQRLERSEARVSVPTPGGEETIEVTADGFAGAIHQLLVEGRGSDVPAMIHRASTGDLQQVAAIIVAREPLIRLFRLVMVWTIRCSEPWAAYDPGRVSSRGRGSYLRGAQVANAWTVAAVCATFPRSNVGAAFTPERSNVPVLLLNGTADPQDPPANVAGAARRFPNSVLVAPEGGGHTVGHLGCIPGVVAAFFAAGSVDGLDTGCVEAMAPPPFALT